jgi:hAT family C-terminal dimerisation region
MDYIPVQASAVPCERVFSSSKETYTKKRNRLNPLMMEILQILKFLLKKERLDFTKDWAASEQATGIPELVFDADPSITLPDDPLSVTSGVAYDLILKAIAVDDIPDTPTLYDL